MIEDAIMHEIEEKLELKAEGLDIDSSKRKVEKKFNFEMLDHAHSELSLQQTKRDQIITLYLAL